MKKEKWREDKKCKVCNPTHSYLSIAVQYSTVQYSTVQYLLFESVSLVDGIG